MPKRKLTRKNIDSKISDVKKPQVASLHRDNWQPVSELKIERSKRIPVKILAIASATLVVLVVIFASYLYVIKNRTEASNNVLFGNLQYLLFSSSGQPSTGRVDIQNAENDINSSATGINLLNFLPFLRDVPKSFSEIGQLAHALIETDNYLITLRAGGLNLFFDGKGDELVGLFKNINSNLKNVSDLSDSIRNMADRFDAIPANAIDNYLVLKTELSRQTDALDSLITLLERPESHILILFEDTSILRPGGGRITAYGDLNIENGSFKSINVKNISVAEKSLGNKIVPPMPLQAQETSWKISDANWFFDFSSSAEKVKSLIESAESNSGNETQYDGVIAVTSKTISDIVSALQPIQVEGLKKPITLDNLSSGISQLGYDRFMNVLLPVIADRVKNLSGDEKGRLAESLKIWIANREVRLYFEDSALQNYISNSNWGGIPWPLGNNFQGDYLGFARADIGTKTSDEETIGLRSQVGADGVVRNNLTVAQKNNSGTVSQNFVQIFSPDNSHLIEIAGNTYKKVSPPINYGNSGYVVDPAVSAIEDTGTLDLINYVESYRAFGRNVFGFWLSSKANTINTSSLTYDSLRINLVDGARYQFVVEREPGENAALNYSIEAPQGWQWHESGKSVFYYSADRIPGRTIINLTLEKSS